MLVLDTNVVSELRKVEAGRADVNVERWVRDVDTKTVHISAITLQELEHGVLLIERRDPVAGETLRHWLDNDVARAFTGRVLPIDAVVARRAAALHVPDPAPIKDALIAATAIVHGMAVVTRNTGDFDRFEGLEVINPWNLSQQR